MAASTTLVSLEEYLRTSYHPDCDYVDGHLEDRRPAEGDYPGGAAEDKFLGEYEHNRLQTLLAAWFCTHEPEWNICTVTEQRIRVASQRIRICDVCLLGTDFAPEKVTVRPPLLCIEILSPEDRLSRATQVLDDYLRMGVPQSWLIDPVDRRAYLYDRDGLREVAATRLQLPGSPVHVFLPDLFARVR